MYAFMYLAPARRRAQTRLGRSVFGSRRVCIYIYIHNMYIYIYMCVYLFVYIYTYMYIYT